MRRRLRPIADVLGEYVDQIRPIRPATAPSDPPEYVRRFAAAAGLSPWQLRWCTACGAIAYAIDDFQRAQLDRLGSRHGCCPDCCPDCRSQEAA
jgi:hypothetical protein